MSDPLPTASGPSPSKPSARPRLWRAIGFALVALACFTLVVLAFAGGVVFERFVVDRLRTAESTPTVGSVGDTADELRAMLLREALRPANDTSMTAGAVKGILESLSDPYASYLDPQHLGFFNEQNDGEFEGIGITVSAREGKPYVVSVIPNTPAEEAGLEADDIIVSIDGTRRDEWQLEEVVKRIRGEAGTKVALEVQRGEEDKLRSFSITRASIDLPNFDASLKSGVGYVRLYGFNAKAADDIREAMMGLERQGAKSFVLDLRDNPGGMLESAVQVTSLFIEDGVVVRVEERGKPEIVHRAIGKKVIDAPLIVLINGNSASASEIVAGALQDHGRARIVGDKSVGKGSVQTVRELSGGGAVKFTIAHYLTPNRREIDGKGVQPDVVVRMTAEQHARSGKDFQLDKAIALLNAPS